MGGVDKLHALGPHVPTHLTLHPDNSPRSLDDQQHQPPSDLETITGELCLKDLATIERAIEAAQIEHKRVKVRVCVCVCMCMCVDID
jgi:hypothetical protein